MGDGCPLTAAQDERSRPPWRPGRWSKRDPAIDISDEVLLAGLGRRHPRLAPHFVARFQASVYGVAYAIVRDPGLAQDVAQQAFEHAWLRADAYDARRGSVRGWLLRITHNLAVDAVRLRRPTPLDPQLLQFLLGQMLRTPEHEALATESGESVRAALAALPIDQARAVVMAVGYGMTAKEIADFADLPIGTVKYRIRSGLLKLHATLPRPGDHDE